jgi:hypothetical protein
MSLRVNHLTMPLQREVDEFTHTPTCYAAARKDATRTHFSQPEQPSSFVYLRQKVV